MLTVCTPNHETVNVEPCRIVVCGTEGNDNIVVNRNSTSATTMWGKVNGQTYSGLSFRNLHIETFGGDDVVNVKGRDLMIQTSSAGDTAVASSPGLLIFSQDIN